MDRGTGDGVLEARRDSGIGTGDEPLDFLPALGGTGEGVREYLQLIDFLRDDIEIDPR